MEEKMGMVNGKVIDLYEMYIGVLSLGGYEEVTTSGLWCEVACKCAVRKNSMAASRCKEYYNTYLYKFEKSENLW